MVNRSAMYGTVSGEFDGIYPNPSTQKERSALDYALIRRKGSKSQNASSWQNYSFYGSFEGKSQTFVPNVHKDRQILDIYSKKANESAIKKFGTTGEEVLKATGLASEIKLKVQDKNTKFVPEMMRDSEIAELMANKAKLKSSQSGVNSMLADIMSLKETDEQKAIAKLTTVGNSLKKYGDALQDIINVGSNIDASVGEMVVKHQESRIGDAIRLDAKSYTSALNIIEQIDYLERITNQIEQDSTKLPNFGLTGGKGTFKDRKVTKESNLIEIMKWSGTGGQYKKTATTKKSIENLTTNLQGSMTNYLGGIYEIAIASTLKSSFGEIFSDVQMTGANTSSGPGATKVALTTTPLGRELSSSTSKTDIRATLNRLADRVNVEMNLSVKNQEFNPGKNSQTKALETGLNFLMDSILTDNSHQSTLEIGFTNPLIFKANSSMNSFMGALMADIAIAGLPGDRIDFMVYQNAVIPLSDYYKVVNRVNIASSSGGQNSAAQDVLTKGSTAIAFRVRTKGF